MKITKESTLPIHSILKTEESTYDYVDSFFVQFLDEDHKIEFADISEAFLQSKPGWISVLMRWRDRLVKPLGLKTSKKSTEEEIRNFTMEKGARLGIFHVYDVSRNEVILGENDRHLDFRISIMLEDHPNNIKNLSISSIVIFNHWFGRLYFMVIKPFHNIIVPEILKGIVAKIESENEDKHHQ